MSKLSENVLNLCEQLNGVCNSLRGETGEDVYIRCRGQGLLLLLAIEILLTEPCHKIGRKMLSFVRSKRNMAH